MESLGQGLWRAIENRSIEGSTEGTPRDEPVLSKTWMFVFRTESTRFFQGFFNAVTHGRPDELFANNFFANRINLKRFF